MRRRLRSLQGRLLALVLGMVVLVWLATAAMTWIDARHELDELLDSHLAQAAALLVVQQARDLGDDEHGVDAPSLHRYAPKVAFQVFHEGRLVLRSANAPAAPMVPIGKRRFGGFATVRIDGAGWRVFAARGAERDVQVHVGEQHRIARLDPLGGAAQHAVADGARAAAAGARRWLRRPPRHGAAAPARPRARRAAPAGAARRSRSTMRRPRWRRWSRR